MYRKAGKVKSTLKNINLVKSPTILPLICILLLVVSGCFSSSDIATTSSYPDLVITG
jgi:hypothetical protein